MYHLLVHTNRDIKRDKTMIRTQQYIQLLNTGAKKHSETLVHVWADNISIDKKGSEYDQEIPQSHTADTRHREEESQNIYSNKISVRE